VIFIPAVYGEAISWVSWLIADAEHIQELFSDANNILFPMYKVVLLIAIQYLLLALLVTSVYYACRRFHIKSKKVVEAAAYVGKDPYTELSAFYMEHSPVAPKQAREAFVLVRNTVEALKFAQGFGMSKDEEVQKLEKEIGDTIMAMPKTYLAIESDEGYAAWTESLEDFNEKVKERNKLLLK
jgi:heptaprenylglyceryl phosphate synthase